MNRVSTLHVPVVLSGTRCTGYQAIADLVGRYMDTATLRRSNVWGISLALA